MKTLKAICTAVILALVLSAPAYADDTTSDPPSESTVPGDIGTPGLTSTDFFEFLSSLVF
jgi:hypothetical protein